MTTGKIQVFTGKWKDDRSYVHPTNPYITSLINPNYKHLIDYSAESLYTVQTKSGKIIARNATYEKAVGYKKAQYKLFGIVCDIIETETMTGDGHEYFKGHAEKFSHELSDITHKNPEKGSPNAIGYEYADAAWKREVASTKNLKKLASRTKSTEKITVGHIDEVVETEYLMHKGFNVVRDFHIVFQGTEYACTQYLIERASHRGFDMADFSIEPFEGRK